MESMMGMSVDFSEPLFPICKKDIIVILYPIGLIWQINLKKIFFWSTVDLQCCDSFRCTEKVNQLYICARVCSITSVVSDSL